jgi:hypothetical protein
MAVSDLVAFMSFVDGNHVFLLSVGLDSDEDSITQLQAERKYRVGSRSAGEELTSRGLNPFGRGWCPSSPRELFVGSEVSL